MRNFGLHKIINEMNKNMVKEEKTAQESIGMIFL